jgi:hypothetical protein
VRDAAPSLSIVIAVKDSAANLPAIFSRLAAKAEGVEVVVAVAGHEELAAPDAVRIVRGDNDALIPHLWRDGIRAANGTAVALTTASCIPARDWVAVLQTLDVARWPGIGGSLDNDPRASCSNWAIYFLRYNAYMPPQTARSVDDLAADNALYRRSAILAHTDLLDKGFWEPSFHARFRAAGETLRLEPGLRVVHHGIDPPKRFAAHRYRHGRQFGQDRVRRLGRLAALAYLVVAPLVPFLTAARIVMRVAQRRPYRRHLLYALPWLCVFIGAWSLGEGRGYLDGVLGIGDDWH